MKKQKFQTKFPNIRYYEHSTRKMRNGQADKYYSIRHQYKGRTIEEADGSYPQVKLLYAEQKICRKAYELTRELEREHASKERRHQIQMTSQHIPQCTPEAAYIAHWQNIRQHITVEDYSRVDSMIALRMRATEHSFEAVAHAVQNCAPDIRESEQRRNWPDYAQRTARYAFGVAGDLDLQKNEKYVGYWQRIEQGQEAQSTKSLAKLR